MWVSISEWRKQPVKLAYCRNKNSKAISDSQREIIDTTTGKSSFLKKVSGEARLEAKYKFGDW